MSGTMIQSTSMDKMKRLGPHICIQSTAELPNNIVDLYIFVVDSRFPYFDSQMPKYRVFINKWHNFISHLISFLNFGIRKMQRFSKCLMPLQTEYVCQISSRESDDGIQFLVDSCQQKKWNDKVVKTKNDLFWIELMFKKWSTLFIYSILCEWNWNWLTVPGSAIGNVCNQSNKIRIR